MGYHTDFEGELKITPEFKMSELQHINKFLNADCREHPEWDEGDLMSIDLELTEDFTKLKWNGSEGPYDMVGQVNFIIREMKKINPDFKLEGSFLCDGEETGDIWHLIIDDNGEAQEVKVNTKLEIKKTNDVFELERNSCECHPETCNCNDWVINKNGNKFVTIFAKADAEEIVEALNYASSH